MSSSEINELSVDEALERLKSQSASFIDVRDAGSYRRGHLPGAAHIGDHNVEAFVRDTDKGRAVVVYCYHGNSSLGGAAYLEENGFSEVYSMSGGFAEWGNRPTESLPEPTPPPRPAAPGGEPAAAPRATAERPQRRGLRSIAKAIVRRLSGW